MKKVAFERLHIKLPFKAPSYFYFSHLIKTQISLLWIAPTEIGRHLCRSHSVYYLFGLTVEHKSRSAELLSGFLHPNQSTRYHNTKRHLTWSFTVLPEIFIRKKDTKKQGQYSTPITNYNAGGKKKVFIVLLGNVKLYKAIFIEQINRNKSKNQSWKV